MSITEPTPDKKPTLKGCGPVAGAIILGAGLLIGFNCRGTKPAEKPKPTPVAPATIPAVVGPSVVVKPPAPEVKPAPAPKPTKPDLSKWPNRVLIEHFERWQFSSPRPPMPPDIADIKAELNRRPDIVWVDKHGDQEKQGDYGGRRKIGRRR